MFAQRLDGFNVIATPEHPYGSRLRRARAESRAPGRSPSGRDRAVSLAGEPRDPRRPRRGHVGRSAARCHPRSARARSLGRGETACLGAGKLGRRGRAAFRERLAERGSQAIVPRSLRSRKIAAEEKAEAHSLGTELERTTQRPEWLTLIARMRAVFPDTLIYVAHNADEAETVPFWSRLDAIGVTLYPPLGADRDRTGRLEAMNAVAKRLDQLAVRTGKPVTVGEIGMRSAQGAAAKPGKARRSAAPRPIRCCRPKCWPTGSACCAARRSTAC